MFSRPVLFVVVRGLFGVGSVAFVVVIKSIFMQLFMNNVIVIIIYLSLSARITVNINQILISVNDEMMNVTINNQPYIHEIMQ